MLRPDQRGWRVCLGERCKRRVFDSRNAGHRICPQCERAAAARTAGSPRTTADPYLDPASARADD